MPHVPDPSRPLLPAPHRPEERGGSAIITKARDILAFSTTTPLNSLIVHPKTFPPPVEESIAAQGVAFSLPAAFP